MPARPLSPSPATWIVMRQTQGREPLELLENRIDLEAVPFTERGSRLLWLNPNYLLIDGLFRAGYPEVADSLRRRTLDLITRDGGDMNEYYNPLSGAKPPGATTMFGWTAALFIDLAVAAAWDGDVDADPVAPSKDAHREDIQTS